MSKKVKIARIIIFMIIAAVCITITYRALAWKDTLGHFDSSMMMLYSTPEDTIDVAFVGNSHVNIGINPEVLWRDYGWSAFDLTVSGTNKYGEYHIIKEMLKTQSPDLVVVDLHSVTYEEMEVTANVYRTLLGMRTSLNSVQLVNDIISPGLRLDYIFRFPIIHTRYRELTRYDFVEKPINSYGRGSVLSYHTEPFSYFIGQPPVGAYTDISDSNREWIDNLIELSDENDFELLFIVCPYDLDETRQGMIDSARRYGEENYIATIDGNELFDEIGFNPDTDFSDSTHLNTVGAYRMTSYLAEYIDDNYNLADHRGESDYYQWDLALEHYERLEQADELSKCEDLDSYATMLSQTENVKGIISLEGFYTENGVDYSKELDKLGLNYMDCINGGKWLYDNGTVTKLYDNNPAADPYELNFSDKYDVRIQFTDDEYGGLLQKDNILINRENYSNDGAYLRIIVYDEFLDEIIDTRGF